MSESHDSSLPEENSTSPEPNANEPVADIADTSTADDSNGDSPDTNSDTNSETTGTDEESTSEAETDPTDSRPSDTPQPEPTVDGEPTPPPGDGAPSDGVVDEAAPQFNASPPVEAPTGNVFLPTAPYPPKRPSPLVRGWRAFRVRYARDKGVSAVLTVIALVLVIIVSVVVVRFSQAPAPVQVVEEFLTSVRDAEVNEAFHLTYLNERDRERNPLLSPEVLRDDWEVDGLELVHEGAGTNSRIKEATVEATLKTPDGSTVTSTFELIAFDDEWRVENPLAELTVDDRMAPYLSVNGHVLEELESEPGLRSLLVLPGVYSFEVAEGTIFESTTANVVSVGEHVELTDDSSGNFTTSDFDDFAHLEFDVEIRSSAQGQVQQEVDNLMAECHSNLTADYSYRSTGCPFTYDTEELYDLAGIEYDFMSRWDDMTWHDVTSPEVDVSWDNRESGGFVLQASNDGAVEFTGVTNERAGSIEVDFVCTFGAAQLNAQIGDEGQISVEQISADRSDNNTQCRVAE